MRILLIEDDSATAKMLEATLKTEGFVVDITDLGEDGLEIGKLYEYDLILLDLILPDMNGYDVLRRLRASNVNTPILILSGLSDIDDKVKGLGFGADDYLTKPFNRTELLARIHAIVRRSRGHSESLISTGKLFVNLQSRTAHVKGETLHLTGKEYAILELLSLRKGSTLTKEMFLNHLYGGMDEPELKIIDVFICKLRRKLFEALQEDYIHTVWGRGYVLRDPMEFEKSITVADLKALEKFNEGYATSGQFITPQEATSPETKKVISAGTAVTSGVLSDTLEEKDRQKKRLLDDEKKGSGSSLSSPHQKAAL